MIMLTLSNNIIQHVIFTIWFDLLFYSFPSFCCEIILWTHWSDMTAVYDIFLKYGIFICISYLETSSFSAKLN